MILKHIKELDGVRAIAALMVMFFHFFNSLQTHNAFLILIKRYAFFGQTGVSLFFVLSGFLITRILLNTKHTATFFSNFYIRRSLRIFPLYFLFLIIYYFIVPFLENTPIVPFNQQIYFWVYLQNIAMTFKWSNSGPQPFWSLAVEEHFYLFWPLLIYFFDKYKIKISIVLIILLALLVRIILIKNNYNVFYFTFSRMDELAVGALLAILELEGKLELKNSKKFLLLFCLVIIPTIALWTLTSGLRMDSIQVSKFILLAFCYFSLVGLVLTLKETNWLIKFLKLKALSYTGKISYGLYVYHPLCFYLLSKYLKLDSVLLSFIFSFAFTYIIAGISYHFFESKFLVLKKKFAPSLSQVSIV